MHECGGAFVIIDRKTRHIVGSTRFYGYDPEKAPYDSVYYLEKIDDWIERYGRFVTLPPKSGQQEILV